MQVSTVCPPQPPLTEATINPKVVKAQYAVRGKVLERAGEIQKELDNGGSKYTFKKIYHCNIGNPQKLGQEPITFNRQVLACCAYPKMMDEPAAKQLFPSDVLERAKFILERIGVGGTGAYSHSKGIMVAREAVARFIEERDGYPADPERIYLTGGASPGIQRILTMLVRDSNDGVMIPIPQYPLYSGALALLGAQAVGYYLDEADDWSLTCAEMKRAYDEAAANGVCMRAMVVINPSNPTGTMVKLECMQNIVKFCKATGMALLVDEVYQANVYAQGRKFISFKKVVRDLAAGSALYDDLQLVSFHSVSKGLLGECGRRGGYLEICGFTPDFEAQLLKLSSLSLCSNIPGQILTMLMCEPPKEGQPSYPLYKRETEGIYESLKRRAALMSSELAKLEGVTCVPPPGAMYVFPRIPVPEKAAAEAAKRGISPDLMYCLELLEATGIVVVPGCGFRQVEGTFHFRSSILPSEADFADIVKMMGEFHGKFMDTYR